MSDSTQQYILKPGVEIEFSENFYPRVTFKVDGNEICHINSSIDRVSELFQPLDIPAIEKQLEEITEKIYYLGVKSGRGDALWPEEESYIDDEIFNGEILGLFGLENKETDDE